MIIKRRQKGRQLLLRAIGGPSRPPGGWWESLPPPALPQGGELSQESGNYWAFLGVWLIVGLQVEYSECGLGSSPTHNYTHIRSRVDAHTRAHTCTRTHS